MLATLTSMLKTPISIHAPREGSDRRNRRRAEKLSISIHAPREGSDSISCAAQSFTRKGRFQSTLPVRGATLPIRLRNAVSVFISIHAPREGSDSRYSQKISAILCDHTK